MLVALAVIIVLLCLWRRQASGVPAQQLLDQKEPRFDHKSHSDVEAPRDQHDERKADVEAPSLMSSVPSADNPPGPSIASLALPPLDHRPTMLSPLPPIGPVQGSPAVHTAPMIHGDAHGLGAHHVQEKAQHDQQGPVGGAQGALDEVQELHHHDGEVHPPTRPVKPKRKAALPGKKPLPEIISVKLGDTFPELLSAKQ
jgi:hypothetical protein